MGAGFYVNKGPDHVVSIIEDIRIRGWRTCLISRNISILHISLQDEKKDPLYAINLKVNTKPSLIDCNQTIIIVYPKRFPTCNMLLLVVNKDDDESYLVVDCSRVESKNINAKITDHTYQTFKLIVVLEGVNAMVVTQLNKEDRVRFIWAKKWRDASNEDVDEVDKPLLIIQKKTKEFYDLIFCEKKSQQLSYNNVILNEQS